MLNKYYSYICEIPSFLKKYLKVDIFLRLKNVSYFCGMDFASKDVYNFKYPISRYDHSISTALITWKFTHDKAVTVAALFHDVSTPCFSHVIDYMNGDYIEQASTEEKTAEIICSSDELRKCLEKDKIAIEDVIKFDKYSIVDNRRPKLCADRFDGITLPSFSWTGLLDVEDSKEMVEDLELYINEEGEKEIGFKHMDIAKKALFHSDKVNEYCHTEFDSYMMMLLANLTKFAISNHLITYNDLYKLDEKTLANMYDNYDNSEFQEMWIKFKTIKKKDIPKTVLESKNKVLNPLVSGVRMQ